MGVLAQASHDHGEFGGQHVASVQRIHLTKLHGRAAQVRHAIRHSADIAQRQQHVARSRPLALGQPAHAFGQHSARDRQPAARNGRSAKDARAAPGARATRKDPCSSPHHKRLLGTPLNGLASLLVSPPPEKVPGCGSTVSPLTLQRSNCAAYNATWSRRMAKPADRAGESV